MVSTKSYLIDITGKLRLDNRVGRWCQLPYPGHPNGCPNYGKRSICPPFTPTVTDFFNLRRKHWFLITEFPLEQYLGQMRKKHPSWSERRLRCLLYWQGHVRKEQYQQINDFRNRFPETVFSLLPEAMTVNVILTLRHIGIDIEVKPQRKILKIALIGYPNPNFLPQLESCPV